MLALIVSYPKSTSGNKEILLDLADFALEQQPDKTNYYCFFFSFDRQLFIGWRNYSPIKHR